MANKIYLLVSPSKTVWQRILIIRTILIKMIRSHPMMTLQVHCCQCLIINKTQIINLKVHDSQLLQAKELRARKSSSLDIDHRDQVTIAENQQVGLKKRESSKSPD